MRVLLYGVPDPVVCRQKDETGISGHPRALATTILTAPRVLASGVARKFGSQWVLRGVDISVAAGECLGVLGANGSGKSTLLRILGTLLRPNAGVASIDGFDVAREAEQVRRVIGCLSHQPGLYEDLSARENLQFAASMLGTTGDGIAPALERVGLLHAADERVRGFSAGMRRRVALARLLLRAPSVLLFDEPYSNLDTDGVELVNSVIRETVHGGGTAIVVIHEIAPAATVLDRTERIVAGRVVLHGVGDGLNGRVSSPDIVVAAGGA